ncbi:60S ribosomal protein L26 [Tupaia chinensis]|uniref:60S ribosomal protein L26 n=1 Tax=Tupaia chinensis TaxID=246437 RepID=L9JD96_TUPCH|nr:60S ribosomal protein L26 [Tupaia chinensis]
MPVPKDEEVEVGRRYRKGQQIASGVQGYRKKRVIHVEWAQRGKPNGTTAHGGIRPSKGLCRDTQGSPALAEPLSDKAASPALAALGAGEEFTEPFGFGPNTSDQGPRNESKGKEGAWGPERESLIMPCTSTTESQPLWHCQGPPLPAPGPQPPPLPGRNCPKPTSTQAQRTTESMHESGFLARLCMDGGHRKMPEFKDWAESIATAPELPQELCNLLRLQKLSGIQ